MNGLPLLLALLAQAPAPADGDQDLVFTEAVLDYMESNYCIDRQRIFATGHSWGGDMAQVVSCFLGPRLRASVPVAAMTRATDPPWTVLSAHGFTPPR